MNIEVALQRYKDVFLPDVIDNSQGDFLAKHVPMRNLLLIDHDEPTDNDKKNPLTEEDIYERVFSAGDDDQFVLVKGASGAGKSHLIRWFESMLQIHKQDNEIVLYLRRADNTLKGTIKQLVELEEIKNLPNTSLYKKLASASTTIPELELKNTIYYSFINLIESDDGKAGEDEERIISNVDRKHFIALLQNSIFKDRLMDTNGPIDRIYNKIAENKTFEHLPEVRAAVAALSPEDRELLAAVQASPFKLTAPEQFKEFADNIDYFVFEPNIHDLNDLGWRYLAQHMDMLLPPELLKAIDPVPFGKYAMQEEQGHFTEHGYISLSGDEWNHERPAEPEKKPSIRERLEQGKKECAEKNKAQPHKEKSAPEL